MKTTATTAGRRVRRTRVTCTCVKCRNDFRYNYSGTGPYRSVCNECLTKGQKVQRKNRGK